MRHGKPGYPHPLLRFSCWTGTWMQVKWQSVRSVQDGVAYRCIRSTVELLRCSESRSEWCCGRCSDFYPGGAGRAPAPSYSPHRFSKIGLLNVVLWLIYVSLQSLHKFPRRQTGWETQPVGDVTAASVSRRRRGRHGAAWEGSCPAASPSARQRCAALLRTAPNPVTELTGRCLFSPNYMFCFSVHAQF